MAVRIQFRRGTAAEWTSANPTLAAGELGYETDTTKFKLGDGSTNWTTLTYAGVTQADIEAAVEDIVGLAPADLDTLVELAAAIGDDPDFINTISTAIDTHADDTTGIHGIVDTSLLETQSGAQTKADSALSAAQQYADNAVANLISSAPSALNTLNELAAALGDDENFSTTITNSLAEKLPYVADTLTNLSTANAVTELDTVYIVGGIGSGYLKIGDNINHWNDVPYVGQGYADQIMSEHNALEADVHGISDAANLAYQVDITNALSATEAVANSVSELEVTVTAHTGLTQGVHGIADVADLVTTAQLSGELSNAISAHNSTQLNVHGIANTAQLLVQSDLSSHTSATEDVHGISDTSNLIYTSDLEGVYAPLSGPTFTGTVELPSTTSIGDISAAEILALDNVASNIQTQLDAKLGSSTAATTYAPLANASFVGTIALPALTSIGDVSATEIGYLDGVTSAVQTQLDAKAPTADPTFTGTVSGVTKAHVGLGDVDNTSDADKPVSTATQTALDAKLSLAGGTMTGKITLDGNPTQALHASTKEYVDNVASGILAKPAVYAATTANLTSTYSNGTDGVGATLTATSNGAFPLVDGVQLTTSNGTRGILVKNQSNAYENGRYNLTTLGDASNPWVLTRCGLCDTPEEIPGMYVFVTDGSLNEGTGWVGYVADPTTFEVGTHSISFFQFAGAGSVTAGSNIAVSGNQVSLVDAPVLTDVLTLSSDGVEFSDGTVQTSAGVPSISSFVYKTASYTLDSLALRDNIIEVSSSSATTITIPADADTNYPVGSSIDILQTNTGQVTIAGAGGVTVNSTPGLKLRTQWSSATLLKRAANTWIVYGDLTA
jgi:hypothetical protein